MRVTRRSGWVTWSVGFCGAGGSNLLDVKSKLQFFQIFKPEATDTRFESTTSKQHPHRKMWRPRGLNNLIGLGYERGYTMIEVSPEGHIYLSLDVQR